MTNYVGFGEAIALFFKNYTNFSGRSSRSEYWWIVVFNILVSIAFSVLMVAMQEYASTISVISLLYSLAFFIPGLALFIRRLHDTGRNGWYMLIALIPIVGAILLFIRLVKGSDDRNEWGPPPGQTR